MTNSSPKATGTAIPDSCASCGTSAFEEFDGDLSPICSECGFVVGNEAEAPPPSNEDEQDDLTETESWSEYYSVTNSTEQQIATAIEELESLGDGLSLVGETREQAAKVYAAAARENVTDGRRTRLVVAAAVCIGAREERSPRPSDRVAQCAGVASSELKRTIRTLQEELDRGYPGVSAAAYIPFLCAAAGVEEQVEQQAIQVAERFQGTSEHSGNHPAGLAGAAVYFASDGGVTQREIARVAGVTKETIRVRLADLREVSER